MGAFHHQFRGHGGFQERVNMPVGPLTVVLVSICELDSSGNPHQGLASMSVHNVVPADGHVTVRGNIDWGSDITARLNILTTD